MAHGTYNSYNEFYLVIMEKCDENTLNIIMGEGYHCKKNIELNEYFKYGAIHFYFIDQYVDVLNYKEPNRKYFYRIESKISKDSLSQNHLNFNPSIIKTYNGLLWEHKDIEKSYVFERNDVIMTQYSTESDSEMKPIPRDKNESIDEIEDQMEDKDLKMEDNEMDIDNDVVYMAYYFWLENRIQDYIRNYKKIQDVLSNIGGIYQVITIIAGIINNFYNNYITLCDTQLLIFSFYSNFAQEKKNKRNTLDSKELSSNSLTSRNVNTKKSISSDSLKNSINSNCQNQITEKQKVFQQTTNINNCTYVEEKKYKFEGSFFHKGLEKKEYNSIKNINYPNFMDYFKYEIGYKNNLILKKCEEVRKAIISEEYFIKSILIINRLLKEVNISLKEFQNDFDLSDVIKL